MQEKGTEKIALFVDIENFIGFSRELRLPIELARVIEKLTETGRVLFRRSFGDISQSLLGTNQSNRLTYVRQMLQRNLVQHEDVPYDSKYKNSSDIRLVVEALNIAFSSPDITTFAIVSSDRDYIPLFAKLRELGKDVTGVSGSPATVGDRYKTACDTIFYVEDLYKAESELLTGVPEKRGTAEPVTAEPVSESYLREQYLSLLMRAVSLLAEQGRKTVGAEIAPKMRQLQPDFDANRAGFSSFKRFISFAKERGLVLTKPQGMDVLVTLPLREEIEEASRASQGMDVLVTLPASIPADAPPRNLPESTERGSTDVYRRFIEGKLRQPLPSQDLRLKVYEATEDIMNNEKEEQGISLNDLSHDVADRLLTEGIPIRQPAVFKLLYSLYRARCFKVEEGLYSYDPQILQIIHSKETWDKRFIYNALYLMGKEMRDTPFIAKNLSILFYENEEKADLIAEVLDSLQISYT